MYLNYGDILELILSINNEIRIAYELKEEYMIFNSKMNIDEARENFDVLLNDFIEANIYEYTEFITLLKNWKEEIINSFTTVKGRRINNGIAESINQNVATIIYNTKGIRNNIRRRKRIMYSINKENDFFLSYIFISQIIFILRYRLKRQRMILRTHDIGFPFASFRQRPLKGHYHQVCNILGRFRLQLHPLQLD